MLPYIEKLYRSIINPPADEALAATEEAQVQRVPTLWLLGNTGAGKSSLVARLTRVAMEEEGATIGDGFRPCTAHMHSYDFPAERPVIRLLDTRGLAEASYDPAEDLRAGAEQADAIVVVARMDDPEQSSVVEALGAARRNTQLRGRPLCVVLTHRDEVGSEREFQALRQHHRECFDKAWDGDVHDCAVDLSSPENRELDDFAVEEMLVEVLPELALWLERDEAEGREEAAFAKLKSEVLWYAGTASTSDLLPALATVAVPAIQGKLLHSLAQRMGTSWTRRTFFEFTGTLGLAFAAKYGLNLGARQLAKLIPGLGQTAIAAASAAVSFASTYALGRSAAYYLWQRQHDRPVARRELTDIYREAFASAHRSARQHSDENSTHRNPGDRGEKRP